MSLYFSVYLCPGDPPNSSEQATFSDGSLLSEGNLRNYIQLPFLGLPANFGGIKLIDVFKIKFYKDKNEKKKSSSLYEASFHVGV